MGDITNLADRRHKKSDGSGNFNCPDCKSGWFMAKVAVGQKNGRPTDVVGYAHPLRCVKCGWAQED